MNRSIFFASVITCAAVFGVVSPSIADESTIEGVYTIDPSASDDINAAIETAVAPMNFIVRSVARGRLKKTNPAYQRIAISRSANEIVVVLDTRKPIRMPTDGSSIKWTREDGEKFDLKAEWKDTQLVQTYVAEDGQRVNDFSLSPDPNLMTLHVTVTSGRLKTPMQYKLAYKRITSQ